MVENLGESSVPYNPTIIEKTSRLEFSPSLLEFIYWKGQTIAATVQVPAANNTILYTVPENYVLFITDIWLSGMGNGVGSSFCALFSSEFAINLLYLPLRISGEDNTVTLNLKMPLMIQSGTVRVSSGLNFLDGYGGIFGILLHKELLPQF